LLQEASGDTRVHQIVINEAFWLVNKDIPDIFDYINSTTSIYKPIQYELVDAHQKIIKYST
jgi:prophage antirepressor-like protein